MRERKRGPTTGEKGDEGEKERANNETEREEG